MMYDDLRYVYLKPLETVYVNRVGKAIEERGLAIKLAPMVAGMLRVPIRAAKRSAETLYVEQPAFFCGYLLGLADVMSQGADGEPGGFLSQDLTRSIMIELFGQKQAETIWPQLLGYMHGDSPRFEAGITMGGEDGDRIANKGLPRKLGKLLGLA